MLGITSQSSPFGSRVRNFQSETTRTRLTSDYPDRNLIARRRHPILDRILYERLQDQRRQSGALQILGYVNLDIQAFREPHPVNVQVEAL